MAKFPIGFWNYTATGDLGPEAVRDWADLGMTMAVSPEYHAGQHDRNAMLAILDACAAYGIRVILSDSRARWGGASDDPAAYERQFTEAYEDFGRHPAVMGFHVGDEPWSDKAFADCIAAHRMQLKVAPELTPHLNFLPYWEGQEKDVLKAPTFIDWARRMAEQADLKILCYDCYSQMNPEEAGVHTYFTNLRKFSEAADACGITPWTTLLSVGHFRYRVPNEDDLRWQLNTAVASGMKGILWFFVYERAPMANYRLPPIDEFGERTETFHRMSRVNRHFLHQFGDFFLNAEHKGTYHTVKAYGGYELFRPGVTSDVLLDVESVHNLPAVVGFFEKDGEHFVAVVNNTTTESGQFRLHVPKSAKTFQRMNWDGSFSDLKTHSHDACYFETDTEQVGGDWLAPGQLKVYKYE
ncbi:MAG: hypothetical protein ACI4V1_03190 [Eubacteriales bacterium]